jgi:hypothetical protein
MSDEMNPHGIQKKDIIFIPGGRGHDRGFFLVKAVEEYDTQHYDYKLSKYVPAKAMKIIANKVAQDDGTDANGRTDRDFRPQDCRRITVESVKKEEDDIVQAAAEKRERLINLLKEANDADI